MVFVCLLIKVGGQCVGYRFFGGADLDPSVLEDPYPLDRAWNSDHFNHGSLKTTSVKKL